MGSNLLGLIANPGALDIQGDRAAQAAQIAQSNAATAHTSALAQEQQTKNAILQQSVKDADIWRGVLADAAQGKIGAPAAPAIATPGAVNGPGGPPAASVASYPNMHTLLNEGVRRGLSGRGGMDLADKLLGFQERSTKLTADERANEQAVNELVGSHLQNIQDAPPEQRAAVWQQAIPFLQKADPSVDWAKVDPTNDAQLQGLIGNHVLHANLIGQKKTAQEIAASGAAQKASEASAANSAAQLPGITADSALKQQVSEGTVNGLTPQQQAEKTRADAQLAHENAVLAETTQRDRAAAANASGNLGVSQARNAREQQVYEQTYGAGSNEALRGVDPKLRTAATSAAQKAADEYTKSQSAERDMQTFLDAARAGNKEAHAYLSPEGVLTLNTGRGVSRVNRQEIDAYAGAGSLFDNLAGKLGKLTSGQSIPKAVMDDIETLHKAISGNSAATYNSKLGSINQNYRSNFKPVEGAKQPAAPADPKVKAYADTYFGGDVSKAQAAIDQQRSGK